MEELEFRALEELERRTFNVMDASELLLQRIGELVIAYSFSVIGAIILLIVGYILAGVAQRSVDAGLSRFRGFDATLRKFFSRIARYAVLVLVGVTVLAQFGVQTASIIAALGAIGLAVGLALQGTLQNIAAGIMLLALRPFRVGEFIEAGGISGTVQEIGLFATELHSGDGIFVMVPNSQLWNTPVTNFSRNPRRAHNLTVRIGYEDDIGLALETMKEIVGRDERVMTEPPPHTYVSALGESAIDVTIRYWTRTADWWQAQLDFTRAVKQTFDEKGISIPLPQQEVRHVTPSASDGKRT